MRKTKKTELPVLLANGHEKTGTVVAEDTALIISQYWDKRLKDCTNVGLEALVAFSSDAQRSAEKGCNTRIFQQRKYVRLSRIGWK